MKFSGLITAAAFATAAHAAGQAVQESDFAGLDAFLANIDPSAVAAAQSSIEAGAQPTTTAATPAESSQAAALAGADDGLPSEEDIDKLIASAAAQFGSAGAGLLPTAIVAARDGGDVMASASGVATAAAAAPTGGLVVDGGHNGSEPSHVSTAAAAPRQALGGLAVAGMIAAYFL